MLTKKQNKEKIYKNSKYIEMCIKIYIIYIYIYISIYIYTNIKIYKFIEIYIGNIYMEIQKVYKKYIKGVWKTESIKICAMCKKCI